MIGTLDNAELAFLYAVSEEGDNMPNGWEFLGSGVDRTVYLGPDTVVYKIAHEYRTSRPNLAEYEACTNLAGSAPYGYGVPKAALYDVEGVQVLAMEFLGDDNYELTAEQANIACAFYQNSDTHGGNMRRVEDVIYMIDLGHYNSNYNDSDGLRCDDSCCR